MSSNITGTASRRLVLILAVLAVIIVSLGISAGRALDDDDDDRKQRGQRFTTDFRLEDCSFVSQGANPYFILEPGYQLVFEGEEDGAALRLEITVLDETVTVDVPGVGAVEARVVEERETADGEIVEISRNFFAICDETNAVYYFGEDVDIYNEDGMITHEGQWRAGEPDDDGVAEPGLIMPGTFLLGSRYYQELADGIALDRAEHVEMGIEISTPAGDFTDCVRVVETTPLEPGRSIKIYCPEVGLVVDRPLELVEYGFNIVP